MTFSDRNVAEYLNDRFVCVWRNRAQGTPWESFPHIEDFRWEENFPQGTGNGAVNIYFCASNGFVMNELGGFWAPKDFLEEAQFTVDAARALTRGGETVARDTAARELTRRHDEAAGRLERELANLQMMKRAWDRAWAGRIQALSQRIGFHRVQAQSPLQDVETLFAPEPVPLPGG